MELQDPNQVDYWNKIRYEGAINHNWRFERQDRITFATERQIHYKKDQVKQT